MRPKTICGARRKYDGQPCQAKALRKGRCKLHGGMSTGPKTPEGRARIASAMRAKWTAKRSEKILNEIKADIQVSQQISIPEPTDAPA